MEPVFERYVSREMGILMKEKGFDQHVGICYDDKENVKFFFHPDYCKHEDWYIYCPTLSLAMCWLREQYKLHCDVGYDIELGWYFQIVHLSETVNIGDYEEAKIYHNKNDYEFKSYEDAGETAVKYCLKKLI